MKKLSLNNHKIANKIKKLKIIKNSILEFN